MVNTYGHRTYEIKRKLVLWKCCDFGFVADKFSVRGEEISGLSGPSGRSFGGMDGVKMLWWCIGF